MATVGHDGSRVGGAARAGGIGGHPGAAPMPEGLRQFTGSPPPAREPSRPITGSAPAPHRPPDIGGPAPRHEPERPGHGPAGVPYPGRPTRGDAHPQSGRFQPRPLHWTEPGRPGWPHYRADRPGFYPGFHPSGGRPWTWDRRRGIERGRRWPWLYRAGWEGAPPDETVRWAQACLARLLGPGVPQDGILGVLTQNAIRQFQAEQQIPATGMLDGDTIAAIRAACGEQEAVIDGDPMELRDVEEPYPPQPWPPSRRFNPPPPQTIPTGRYQTFSPCDAVLNDFDRLAAAADDLKDALRQQPADLARIANRADIVTAVSREIVARLSARHYVQIGCSREDLATLASSVNVLRGPGADGDVGSWPPVRSGRAQGPRTQARQSLRHLLAWCRRAAKSFPNI
jgi:Putative peptidoglycan binding domain